MSKDFESSISRDDLQADSDRLHERRDERDEQLVSVGRFLDPVEAQMAKGMLESAGIECFLQGANANAIVPLAFRVRLQVRVSDEAAARGMMADAADRESADGS